MLLHTLNKASNKGLQEDCTRGLAPEDALLLIEDGVLAILDAQWVASLPCPLYVLEVDIQARGLDAYLSQTVRRIDYARFVALCCEFDNVINWH